MVREDGSDPLVPAEVSRDFRMALTKYLYDRGPFVHGPELHIVYQITGVPSTGEGVSSVGVETIGTGSVTAEVKFYNFVEREIASIQVEGDARDASRIDRAVRECAWQVASYAKRNFWEAGKGSGGERIPGGRKYKNVWKPANGGAQ
jgi:hypothetical protein